MSYYDVTRRKGASASTGHTPLIIALIFLFFAAFFMVASKSGDLASKNLPFTLGEIAGGAAALGALTWAVVYFGFVRRKSPARGGLYALILIGFSVLLQQGVAGLLIAQQHVAAAEKAEKDQMQVAANSVESSLSALEHPGSDSAPTTAKPRATGDAGEVERLLTAFLGQIQSDHEDYLRDMAATGIQDVLKPARLAKDKSLRAALESIEEARSVVKAYQARAERRRNEFRHAIETSALSPAKKQELLAGVDHSSRDAGESDTWGLEMAILDEFEATARDLRHSRGRWSITGRGIMFTDQGDLAVWRGHIAAIQGYGRREETIRANWLRQMHQGVAQMRQGN
jgi:hypothetical protein